jgi:hypothetical protein
VVLSPNMRASYSAMLLVALKSRCTMYLNYSPVGVRSRAVEEESPVRLGEDRSFDLWLGVVRASKVA